jgi:hypothetical protein|nr:MAG TPA: hypothetical protein [Caudoviricetes sp.]
MTIQDFMELLIDGDSQHFNVYDNEKEEIIFDGFGSEIPDELLDEEVSSMDNVYGDNDIILLNIN